MRLCHLMVALVVGVGVWLGSAGVVWGDGFIVVHGTPARAGHFAFTPMEVKYHRVQVGIEMREGVAVATTQIEEAFYNPNGMQLEGTYLFPLPVGATIDRFAMDINGTVAEAELLNAEKARGIYEEIVRKYKDPALLEYVGRDAFKVRIFPIEPHGTKVVKIRYSQVIKGEYAAGGSGRLYEYVYPLNTEKFSSALIDDVSVKVEIRGTGAIKGVYSPSHEVEVKRPGDVGGDVGGLQAVVGFEGRRIRPDTDFKLIFTEEAAGKDVGVQVLTYKVGKQGYFMVMAGAGGTGGGKETQSQIQPKDVCFVLDTSGSMSGAKLEQAKGALRYCLSSLREGDRFDIVRFSTDAEALFGEMRLVSDNKEKDGSRAEAMKFVDGLRAVGGTAIEAALRKNVGMRTKEPGRIYTTIFLTDGQPTLGVQDPDKLVGIVVDGGAGGSQRVFPFGIGNDVNTLLLDRIANETKGISQYVLPSENIEVKVSSFFEKIESPVLVNVKLVVSGDGVRAGEVTPPVLPDLFKGETLLAFGRYEGNGKVKVELSGMKGEKVATFSTEAEFPEKAEANAFIPKFWATRRVGWLLDEIRMHGESKEVKDEIVALAREFGIVTPYTSYLILEDEARRNVPVAQRTMRELESDSLARENVRAQYDSASRSRSQEVAGARAVENAQVVNGLKSSANASTAAPEQYAMRKGGGGGMGGGGGGGPGGAPPAAATAPNAGYRENVSYSQQVRVAQGRAFFQNSGTWTDSRAQTAQNLKQQKVTVGSEEYFALIKAHPGLEEVLALGPDVDVVVGDVMLNVRAD